MTQGGLGPRMIIRRRKYSKYIKSTLEDSFDWEAERDAQAFRDLANPNVYFPLLGGGVHGSSELQKKYGESI